jgi:hypothetical protein
MAMSQAELRRLWEARHGRRNGGPERKEAIPYAEVHGAGTTAPTGAYLPPVPVGLPPELEARVQEHKANHYGEPICPACRLAKDQNSRGGRCPHRPAPAEAAERRRWESKAAAVMAAQQLGRAGDYVRVVEHDRAMQEDSHQGRPPIVDRVTII